jgi:hypothetical protein
MNDAQERLVALLDKVEHLLPFAGEKDCKDLFDDVARFAETAAETWHAREQRTPLSIHALIEAAEGSSEHVEENLVDFLAVSEGGGNCKFCKKRYRRELLCDKCDRGFRWCCEGYQREPCNDPVSTATGVCTTLQTFCKVCMERLSISSKDVLQQEFEYATLEKYFSSAGCGWRWISCHFDGYSLFSAVWVALEGLLFLLSPFYCEIGTERDDTEYRKDVGFLDFVSHCASEALTVIARSPELQSERDAWTKIRDHPAIPPSLSRDQFPLAWAAVSNWLNSESPTSVVIWKYVQRADGGGTLKEEASYGCNGLGQKLDFGIGNDASKRTIDILMWNCNVVTHFDLLLPTAPQTFQDDEYNFSLLN